MNIPAAETAGYPEQGKELTTPWQNHGECTGAFMLSRVLSASLLGIDAHPVEVEQLAREVGAYRTDEDGQ